MRNVIQIILLLLFIETYSQEKIYIEFSDDITISTNELGSHVYINIKSKDKRFITDLYKFKVVNNKSFEQLKFENLADTLSIKPKISISFQNVKEMNSCDLHEMLSLNKIFLKRKIEEKYLVWQLNYLGTQKNAVMITGNKRF